MRKHILSVDSAICCGCGICVISCMERNDVDAEMMQPVWRRVVSQGQGPHLHHETVPVSTGCRHCQNSPCLKGCPSRAITRHKKHGAILVDQGICTGCRTCATLCPYGVPQFDLQGKMSKCNLCIEDLEEGERPACVTACPNRAFRFVPCSTPGAI